MKKKSIPTCAFPTNRLKADWHGADRIKEQFSLVAFRCTEDNRWNSLFKTLRRCTFDNVFAWTTYEMPDGFLWYFMLVDPQDRANYVERLSKIDPAIQCHGYRDPIQCPDWSIILLRLLVNSLHHVGKGNQLYTLFGNLLVISPTNFEIKPCEPDQLIGLSIELTREGCLVAHTKTFTEVTEPLTGKLAALPLYELDAANYKLAPVLRSTEFEAGHTYCILHNRNKWNHNVVPQFVLGTGKELTSKIRLMDYLIEAINTTYGDYVHIQNQLVDGATRVSFDYLKRMVETIHATLTGKTIAIIDTVNDTQSEQIQNHIRAAIEAGSYYTSQTAKKYKFPIVSNTDTPEADCIIRLVPLKEAEDKETPKYLALFQDAIVDITAKAYQHIQVDKIMNKLDNMLPRIMAELAIKQIIKDRSIAHVPHLSFLNGWRVAVTRECDDQGHYLGGMLEIDQQGKLTCLMFGETLKPHEERMSQLGVRLLLMSQTMRNSLFDDQRIGGKGPFYYLQLPGQPRMTLIDEEEFALPNTTNINDFMRRMDTEVICDCEELDQALIAAGVGEIPPYRDRLKLSEQVTANQLETVMAMLKELEIDKTIRKKFRESLPGLRRNHMKNSEHIEMMFGALTDIHYWKVGDSLKYVSTRNSNLNSLTPGTTIVGMPHIRTLRTPTRPGYFQTSESQVTIEQIMQSLTQGFGKVGEGSAYPLPFKILEEWMDQNLLCTLGIHWNAVSSKRKGDKDDVESEEERS